MQAVVTAVITFVLSNFTLTFLVIGLLFALVGIAREPRPAPDGAAAEHLLRWYLFWAIGVTFAYNFVMHVFFGELSARFIGWADSPFQAEVGFASLGFAAVGFLAFRGSRGLRIAAVVGPACFLWGAAAGHAYQMITAGNFEPGNAGIIFWTDILVPLIGFALLRLTGRDRRAEAIGRPV